MTSCKAKNKRESAYQTIWETPPEVFERLHAEFAFTLDAAASKGNAKCERYFTARDDGLSQPWELSTFVNPPYGRGIERWVEKAWRESQRGCTVVMLLPANTDPKWFHRWVLGKAAELRFTEGRIQFGLPPGVKRDDNGKRNGNNKGNMIAIYRPGHVGAPRLGRFRAPAKGGEVVDEYRSQTAHRPSAARRACAKRRK